MVLVFTIYCNTPTIKFTFNTNQVGYHKIYFVLIELNVCIQWKNLKTNKPI